MEAYIKTLTLASVDDLLLRNFALFLESTHMNSEAAKLCCEEADTIANLRKERMMHRALSSNARLGLMNLISKSSSIASSRMNSIREVIELIGVKAAELGGDLSANKLMLSVRVVFFLLVVLVAANTVIIMVSSSRTDTFVEQLHSSGRLRSLSKEVSCTAVRYVHSMAEKNSDKAVSSSDVAYMARKLEALRREYEAHQNSMLGGTFNTQSFRKFIEKISVTTLMPKSNTTWEFAALPFWALGYQFMAIIERMMELDGLSVVQSKWVEFLFRLNEGPQGILFAKLDETTQDQFNEATQNSIIGLIAVLAVSLVTLAAIYLIMSWSFQNLASTKGRVLTLFRLIPRTALERIEGDARLKIEKFITGVAHEKEGGDGVAAVPPGSLPHPRASLDASIEGRPRRLSGVESVSLLSHMLRVAAGEKIRTVLPTEKAETLVPPQGAVAGATSPPPQPSSLSQQPNAPSQEAITAGDRSPPKLFTPARTDFVELPQANVIAAAAPVSSSIIKGSQIVTTFEAPETIAGWMLLILVVVALSVLAACTINIALYSSVRNKLDDLNELQFAAEEVQSYTTIVDRLRMTAKNYVVSGHPEDFMLFFSGLDEMNTHSLNVIRALNDDALTLFSRVQMNVHSLKKKTLAALTLAAKARNTPTALVQEIVGTSWTAWDTHSIEEEYSTFRIPHPPAYATSDVDLQKSPSDMIAEAQLLLFDEYYMADAAKFDAANAAVNSKISSLQSELTDSLRSLAVAEVSCCMTLFCLGAAGCIAFFLWPGGWGEQHRCAHRSCFSLVLRSGHRCPHHCHGCSHFRAL